ncbi:MAG: hypothetical protein L0211_02230 [Planctomycetaceae bacterium]|nr:hypothetical protein [Planctomycetaceae bacterium]
MIARTRRGPELDPVIIAAVLRRLQTQSERSIARELKIGHATVQRIRDGKHTSQLNGPRYCRCGCGALTDVQPCRACQVREPVPADAPP